MIRRIAVGPLALGVCLLALVLFPAAVGAMPSSERFEILPGSFHMVPSTLQAGAHENLVTEFDFAHDSNEQTYNDLKTTIVKVPAGFTANNTAVPTCTDAQLATTVGGNLLSACSPESQVGTIGLVLTINPHEPTLYTLPVFNMEVTTFGVTAELGFKAAAIIAQNLPVSVRPEDEGLTVTSPNIEELAEPHAVKFTVWGVPAASEHDAERDRACEEPLGSGKPVCEGGEIEVHLPVKPFLSNPTKCGSFAASMKANAWETQELFSEASTETAPIVECERVPFNPSIEVQPSTRSAESPTGLDVSLMVPQSWEKPETLASSNLEAAKVTLPEGFTVNPSAGSGLAGCAPAQYEAETAESLPGEGCPPESKIGSIEIETPVLAEKIPGAIYIAMPYDNPFSEPGHPNGSLLALYVVAKDPARGIIVKVAGKLEANPVTGQLVSTFENDPQQPFSRFTLRFRPGATAPLVSPAVCGSYTTQAVLTPWSAPADPRVVSSQPFAITEGVREGPCPSGGVPPFKPQVISGTQNNAGGSYSPFYLRIIREDGEQELTKFSTTLPPGLTGNLTGIPFCPNASIEAAKTVSGAQEEADPSCPAASEIGHTIVEAGVGTVLAQTPGKVYLAGPYNGAPLSIVSITSAKVGPFDLGTVVIRFALNINPVTGQVEVSGAQSDPIPHIIKGIVVHVRDIRVYMSRPDFMLNPTDCGSLSITDAITGAGANPANPADQDTVNVSTPFEAADCASLAFTPTFKVTTSAHTSRTQGASLDTKVTAPAGSLGKDANIKSVKVDLPRQLPSRLTTLQKACTSKQFESNPAGCPAASRVGTAVVHTPILPEPLTGPAYFVSYGAAKFPELIVVLQGYGITIELHGETFISKKGLTSTTFRSVPDEPFESFELDLPQGPYSALTNNGSLCTASQVVTTTKRVTRKVKGHVKTVTVKTHRTIKGLLMPTALTAQNGAVIHETNVIGVTGCAKVKAHKAGKHKGKGK